MYLHDFIQKLWLRSIRILRRCNQNQPNPNQHTINNCALCFCMRSTLKCSQMCEAWWWQETAGVNLLPKSIFQSSTSAPDKNDYIRHVC